MNRKSKRKILFGLKVLAVCGAAVFMVKGVSDVYADGTGIGTGEETRVEKIIQKNITSIPNIEFEEVLDENMTAESEDKDDPKEYTGMIGSMDWDSEDAYLLAKIAMAEAEGEGVEGKALVMLVVLNRVWSDEFPDSISEVIFQKGQFSPVGNGRYDRVEPDQECYEALNLIQLEKWDKSQEALYFESESESDWHRKNLNFLFQHGKHYFYADKELVE